MLFRSLYLTWTILVLLLFSGCSADKRQLEKLGLINTLSYDLVTEEKKGKKLLVSVSIPISQNNAAKKREFLTAVSASSKEARGILARQTSKMLVNGQLRNVLFGKEIAKQGLWSHMDTLVRDPSIGPRVRVIIVNGRASDLLKTNFPDEPETGKYIYRLLTKEEINKTIPEVSIYHFIRDLYDDGIDPVAPVLKLNKERHLVIDGLGLFDHDRYKTKISPKDMLIFSCLRGNLRQGEINLKLKNRNSPEAVTLGSIKNHRTIQVIQNDPKNKFHVLFNLQIKGSLLEYTGKLHLGKNEHREQLENQISRHVKERAELLLHNMQENKVDSVGIGRYVRNRMNYKDWKKLDWKQLYSSIQIQCNVKVEIKDYGKFQ